jgi:hypothetical protein
MIRSEVHRFGRTRQALCLAAAAIIAGALTFTSGVPPASAAPADILLQAPLVGQIFTPPDSGDSGSWDCLPASLTMAISILDQSPADYGSVRRYMRTQSGIRLFGLGQTYGVVEYSTGGRFSADKTYRPAAPDGWRTLVEGELSQGRPLVLYIADASKLEDSSGQALRPANESFTLAHAVLAVGLLNGGNTVVIDDPWNATPGGPGRQLRMTADAFAAAWGNTRFSGGTVYSNAGWNYIGFQPTRGSSAPSANSSTDSHITPTPKANITPTSQLEPRSQVPNAPTNLTDAYVGDGPCPDIAGGDCPKYTFSWSNGGGVVNGYSIYVEGSNGSLQLDPQQAAAECAQAALSDLFPVATISGGTTSYTFYDETPEVGHSCVVVVASNDAGSSSRAVAVPPPIGRPVGGG